MYKLIDKNTGKVIPMGSLRSTGRNEVVRVESILPPRHSGSSGRVNVVYRDTGTRMAYFPSVIDAKIIDDEDADPPSQVMTSYVKYGQQLVKCIDCGAIMTHTCRTEVADVKEKSD
jgi:hypothetical protein